MAYNYEDQKYKVFTEGVQEKFRKIRDTMNRHCKKAGAVSCDKAMTDVSGEIWTMLACIDRLVELGEFECVFCEGARQDYIYRRIEHS